MNMKKINTIAIAGAGTMGSGIAQVTASSGFNTILFDINSEMLEKAKLAISKSLQYLVEKQKIDIIQSEKIQSLIKYTSNIADLVADLIIEAVVERLDVKHQFFQSVAAINGEDTILATNTSSIPVTQIAAKIPFPERVVGIHFFNPAPIMKLVEIISGVQTDLVVAQTCKQLIEGMGKTCVMANDAPGFIVNRVARHFYVEGLKVLEENVASFETIDQLMESSGFKMGPFRLMDLIGVDTNFSVTNSVFNLFHQDGKFRPSRIQQQKVDAGMNGKKSKKGFYAY
ncbi:MAG: 3-hydroxybutyryl-CoA dehydrogenase [Bacteroidia bacterium]|nr:3-hydroxybutyryl-CoA dehydrogenase [Bacteroidia bacterium]MCF8426301.1 3-hydroxybutyryl-CoA dehydrogenase [Bacteroidia bacterium]MCF8446577.1 3-hydroxybutyryl-CoA dehydrogenase [Bacteroidia bacterium]